MLPVAAVIKSHLLAKFHREIVKVRSATEIASTDRCFRYLQLSLKLFLQMTNRVLRTAACVLQLFGMN